MKTSTLALVGCFFLTPTIHPDDRPAPLKPAALHRGDTVGLIAPASPIDTGTVERAVAKLRELGYGVKVSRGFEQPRGYLASSDEIRAAELHRFFADPDVKAIVCLRGGYGTPRILDLLDYELVSRNAKIVMGYSDITALLTALQVRAGLVVFHGPMAREIAEGSIAPGMLRAALEGDKKRLSAWGDDAQGGPSRRRTLVPGVAKGRLVGGNLSVLTSTIGTAYEVDTNDAVLFLEEVNEKPFRIDRMLNQLRLSGKLESVRGILLGSFSGCAGSRSEGSLTLEDVFRDYFQGLGVPVLEGFPAGHHVREQVPLPLGIGVRLDATQRTLEILESPHQD